MLNFKNIKSIIKIIYHNLSNIINYLRIRLMPKLQKNNGVILFSPSASLTGVPLLTLNLTKKIMQRYPTIILSLKSGKIIKIFKRTSTTIIIGDINLESNKLLNKIIMNFYRKGYRSILLTSLVVINYAPIFKKNGFRIISLINEVNSMVIKLGYTPYIASYFNSVNKVIFPSLAVYNGFKSFLINNTYQILPQGLYNELLVKNLDNYQSIRFSLRQKYSIKDDKKIALGIGTDYIRKGFDFFVDIANQMLNENITFFWIGDVSNFNNTIPNNVHVIKNCSPFEIYKFFYFSDIYLMVSRDDPYPSVVLEAMASKLLIFIFDNVGSQEIITNNRNGFKFSFSDTNSIVLKLRSILNLDLKVFNHFFETNNELIIKEFNFDLYSSKLLKLINSND